MIEIINRANAKGACNGKRISATSNPWKITIQRKCHCVCKCIQKTFSVSDLFCNTKCYVYYNGIKQFKINGVTFIRVGYGICIRYKDCDGNKKTVTQEGSVLFYEPKHCYTHCTVNIPNPPCFKICGNEITAAFTVVLRDGKL